MMSKVLFDRSLIAPCEINCKSNICVHRDKFPACGMDLNKWAI